MRRALLLIALLAPTQAQEDPPSRGDADRANEARARYLAVRPYHEQVLEDLVAAARAQGSLSTWIRRYEGAHADGDLAAGVVLARLYAVEGRGAEALSLLEGLDGEDPRRDALVGELHLGGGDPSASLAWLERAAAALPRGEARGEVLRRLAEAQLLLDQRPAAAASLARLLEDAPQDLDLRLEVAELCARGGLREEALAQFEAAQELAGGDGELRSRVLAELGALHERELQPELALEVYDEALDLLGRGHWLEEELLDRLVDLHRRRGSLLTWRAELEGQLEAAPGDLTSLVRLTRALVATGEAQVALERLGAGARRYPADGQLARHRLELARSHGTPGQRVEVLQAALASDPRAAELRYELAEALAAGGRLEAARSHWERLLEEAGRSAEACARVALRRAAWGEAEAALELLQRARDLEPGDLARHADLARHLVAMGRPEAASEALRSAAPRFEGPRALEELAALQREVGYPARAEAPLRRARAALPGDQRLALVLAGLLLDLDRPEEGRSELRGVVESTADPGLRERAARRFVESFRTPSGLAVAAGDEAQRARSGGGRAAYLLAAALHRELGDPAGERHLLAEFLAREPADRTARERLADLLVRVGQPEAALAQLGELVGRFPRSARPWRLERSSLLAELGRLAEAAEELEAIVAEAGGGARALEEVSRAFSALGRADRAIEVLGRSLTLEGGDGLGYLRLAELCLADFRYPEALQHLRTAYRIGTGDVRADALTQLHAALRGQGRLRPELRQLTQQVEARPHDLDAALLLLDLHVLEWEYQQALEVAAAQLARRPYEVRLFRRRASIHLELGMATEAVQDLSSVRALSAEPPPGLLVELLQAHLAAGQVEEAVRVALECEEPLRAASALVEAGHSDQAAQLLDRARRRPRADPEVDRRLGDLHARLGASEPAAAAYRRFLEAGGEDPTVLRRLGDLLWERGEQAQALAVGERLLLASAVPASTRGWFEEKGLLVEWTRLRCERALAHPRDGEGIQRLVQELSETSGPGVDAVVLETLAGLTRAALVEGRVPPGRSILHWSAQLGAWEAPLLGRDPEAAQGRLARARSAVLADGPVGDVVAALHLATGGEAAGDGTALDEVEGVYGDHPLVALGLARLWERAGRPGRAAQLYARAAAALEEPRVLEGERAERERRRRIRVQALRAELPFEVRAGITGESLEGLADLCQAVAEVEAPVDARGLIEGGVLAPGPVRLLQARALATAGEPAQAEELLAQVGQHAGWVEGIRLVRVAAAAGLEVHARRWNARLFEALRGLEEEEALAPVLGRPSDLLERLLAGYRQALVGAGDVALAYDLLRDEHQVATARVLLSRSHTAARLRALYAGSLEALEPGSAAPRDEAWWGEVRRLHDTVLKLAELRDWEDDARGALAAWARVERLLPRDRSVLNMKATYAERSGDREEALAARRALVEVLDGEGALPAEAARGQWLRPWATRREPRARRSVTWVHLSNFALGPGQDPRLDHLLACLRLELELGRMGSGLETLGRVVELAHDPPASWVRNLLHMLGGYAGDGEMPERLHAFHGQLHRLAPQNLQVVEAYVKSLWDVEALEEAAEVLDRYLAGEPRISSLDRENLLAMVERTAQLRASAAEGDE